jgi:hypothetical protein
MQRLSLFCLLIPLSDTTCFGLTGHLQVYMLWLGILLLTVMRFSFLLFSYRTGPMNLWKLHRVIFSRIQRRAKRSTCPWNWLRASSPTTSSLKGCGPQNPPNLPARILFSGVYWRTGRMKANNILTGFKGQHFGWNQNITGETLGRVTANVQTRVEACLLENGGHFQNLLWS